MQCIPAYTNTLCHVLVFFVLLSVVFIAEIVIKLHAYVSHHLCIIGKSGLNLEESSSRSHESKAAGTSIKDVLKEQKFLEKKVALSRKRKRDSSRYDCLFKRDYVF